MRRLLGIATAVWLLIALVASADAVSAQTLSNCAPRADAVSALGDVFAEEVVGMGVASSGDVLIELWLNPATGTWTITGTMAGGATCLLASGEDWQAIGRAIQGDPT